VIAVTDAGKRKVKQADKVLDRVREDVLSVLEPEECEVFLSALGRLACGRLAEPVTCAQTVRRPR
jgi:DNA-binding MarR family transcriptional regulator